MPLYSKIRSLNGQRSVLRNVKLRRVFDAPFLICIKNPYVKKMKEIYKIFLKTVAFLY